MNNKSYQPLLIAVLIGAFAWIFKKDTIIKYLDQKGIKITDPNNQEIVNGDVKTSEEKISNNVGPLTYLFNERIDKIKDSPILDPGGVTGGFIPNTNGYETVIKPTVDEPLRPGGLPAEVQANIMNEVELDPISETPKTRIVTDPSEKNRLIIEIASIRQNEGLGRTTFTPEESADILNLSNGRPLEYFTHLL